MNESERNSRRVIAEASEGETVIMFVVVILMAAILIGFTLWVMP